MQMNKKNYDGSFETETRGSGAKKEDIERHIFSEFKKGLIHEKGEDEGVVFLSSSVEICRRAFCI